jgi:hypothetical protein
MPPKSKKITTEATSVPTVVATPIAASESTSKPNIKNEDNEFDKFQQEWVSVIKEISLMSDKLEQLNTRRDELTKAMIKSYTKTDSSAIAPTIIETPVVEQVEVKTTAATAPKSKSKAKAKVEPEPEPEPESETEEVPVKKTTTKKQPAKKEETPLKKEETTKKAETNKKAETTKKAETNKKAEPTKKAETEVKVVAKTPAKGSAASKLKLKLDEDTEENISKTKNTLLHNSSSSDTDLESLSSCSSESDCSGGEDD